ncbi:hypothetical protein MSAN_00300300 [Mycena sanguinolenta]|uniref:Uncharacterized protein n=1 Tax=Mycena sanguinolenta TaxID=230812 RepID=A0A8H7DH63_9AGAR|nr:hypothetical protein MSAN_00300300 [Mycena sanguinolenta]
MMFHKQIHRTSRAANTYPSTIPVPSVFRGPRQSRKTKIFNISGGTGGTGGEGGANGGSGGAGGGFEGKIQNCSWQDDREYQQKIFHCSSGCAFWLSDDPPR